MDPTSLPRHIAIIMDGNGRWAKQRYLPRFAGHSAGAENVRQIVTQCVEKKIEVLSLFAFSNENWRRPEQEVGFLMDLFISILKRETQKLHAQNIQVRVIGDRTPLNQKLQDQIVATEELTAQNTGLKLIIAANYGGQWDITEAVRKIGLDLTSGQINPQDITPQLLQKYLSLADLPAPDLLIRTSGEQRLSNFMLWQIAYTELYFTDVLWPDFDATEFERALTFFMNRERRFGCTSEQLRINEHA